jgi:acyl carrier protein
MRKHDNVETELRGFIGDYFVPRAGLRTFSSEDSFMAKGIIDSTGVLELIEFIEEKFRIKIEDEELIPDNFDSFKKLARYVNRKLTDARR